MTWWRQAWTPERWRSVLALGADEREVEAIHRDSAWRSFRRSGVHRPLRPASGPGPDDLSCGPTQVFLFPGGTGPGVAVVGYAEQVHVIGRQGPAQNLEAFAGGIAGQKVEVSGAVFRVRVLLVVAPRGDVKGRAYFH